MRFAWMFLFVAAAAAAGTVSPFEFAQNIPEMPGHRTVVDLSARINAL